MSVFSGDGPPGEAKGNEKMASSIYMMNKIMDALKVLPKDELSYVYEFIGKVREIRSASRIESNSDCNDLEHGDSDLETVTIAETARRTKLSAPTIRRLIDSGRIRCVRLGGCRRVIRKSLFEFIQGDYSKIKGKKNKPVPSV